MSNPYHTLTIQKAPEKVCFVQDLKFGQSEYGDRLFKIFWVLNQAFGSLRIMRESHGGIFGGDHEHIISFESKEVRDAAQWLLNKEIHAFSHTQSLVNNKLVFKTEVLLENIRIAGEGFTTEEASAELLQYLKIFIKRG